MRYSHTCTQNGFFIYNLWLCPYCFVVNSSGTVLFRTVSQFCVYQIFFFMYAQSVNLGHILLIRCTSTHLSIYPIVFRPKELGFLNVHLVKHLSFCKNFHSSSYKLSDLSQLSQLYSICLMCVRACMCKIDSSVTWMIIDCIFFVRCDPMVRESCGVELKVELARHC